MSLYNIAQPAGAMISGAMQGGLSTNMEGVLGRAGWRWAFIINVSNIAIYDFVSIDWFLRESARLLWPWWPFSYFQDT